MRVSRYQPVTVEPTAPRRCRFNPVVSERDPIPTGQLQETIDAARLRAKLKRPGKPIIKNVARPKPRPIAPPASDGLTPMTAVLSIVGVSLLAAFIVSSPVGIAVGISLILAAILNHASTANHVAKPKPIDVNPFDLLVNHNYQTKNSVLDLRSIVVKRLPDYLHEFYHLDYILINQSTAAYLKRKHGRIKIIVVSDN